MPTELKTLSQEMIPAVEAEMQAVLHADGTQPDSFYGMMQYHMGWVDEALQPAVVNSGKRIRPLLCLLSCAAAGGDWQQAVPAAAAIEILHNFSLVHDDIEDASDTRRGRQTVWKIWGIEQAINAGDAMFAIAHLAMARLEERGVDPAIVVQALRRFDETCVQLTQGQHADMDFEKRDQVSVAEYLEMIGGKTAVLISLSTELGARIAGAAPQTNTHYNQYGLKLGLAFQVIDDILGIWGDESRTGKSAATDIITKKKTLPVLHGLEHSPDLRQLYTQSDPDTAFVQQAITLLNAAGSHDYARQQAVEYSDSASHHLQAANPNGPAARALHQLTHMLLARDF
ncbi:MAG: polyprenyl synthetase family protein [Ardenticatenaceae bacterium]|nr:polyprenyl synthetase family protein [Anaerolineales bacterium]MCB8922696.1 polyprenyl synthetase family protein [Ardenticatenaceae bacterium]MCB8991755.1 polyprenyl synthetase family protein [Ardenticatenaceae bacterium]MCB9003596.1 polyprenyl synthetase family protein [Ardenticatenaceae bacterium]